MESGPRQRFSCGPGVREILRWLLRRSNARASPGRAGGPPPDPGEAAPWKRGGPRAAPSRNDRVSGRRNVDAFGGRVVVVLQTVLVAADLAVELVHQLVDGRVQVLVG